MKKIYIVWPKFRSHIWRTDNSTIYYLKIWITKNTMQLIWQVKGHSPWYLNANYSLKMVNEHKEVIYRKKYKWILNIWKHMLFIARRRCKLIFTKIIFFNYLFGKFKKLTIPSVGQAIEKYSHSFLVGVIIYTTLWRAIWEYLSGLLFCSRKFNLWNLSYKYTYHVNSFIHSLFTINTWKITNLSIFNKILLILTMVNP